MAETILLTGAAGFLGRHTLKLLLERGYDVVAPDRGTLDLTNLAALQTALEVRKPSVVVHLAASVDFKGGSLDHLLPVNALATSALADYCAKTGAHMLFASGTLVHGFHNELFGPLTPIAPDTDYGISKRRGEEAIERSGCSHTIIRYCGIFGMNGPRHLGINRAISGASSGQQPSLVGSGRPLRNYVFVDDASRDLVRCIEERLTGIRYSSGQTISIRGMIEAISQTWLGSPDRYHHAEGTDAHSQICERDVAFGEPTGFVEAMRLLHYDQ